VSVFARFAPRLQEAIVARLGWTSLRPVQEEAGHAILEGRNTVVLAPTAGGKTEAAMFPAISRLVDEPTGTVGVLYVAPIKALLNNQADRLGLYTEMVGLRPFVWHGDTSETDRRHFLREPAELLMTTPESLEVMLISRRVDAAGLFHDLRIVVIDEVHAVAGTDRGAHLMSVLERIATLSRHDLQRVGLSATIGNPEEIRRWMQGTSRRPGVVVDPPKPPSRRQLLVVHRPELAAIAEEAARIACGAKSLFFCQSRATAEAVAGHMRQAGTTVFVHHSAVSREEREIAEEQFHHGSDACIVCTSTLELGIDVGDLDRVLQAEAPDTVSAFLQRMGRTGRRPGQVANTTFFCETTEGVLQAIALIELARSGWVEPVEVNDRCWPVFIHQLLAMSLANDGIALQPAWEHLSRVPDFQGIRREEFDRLVAWMIQDGSFVLAGGRLVLGPRAEQRFGRRNFMELFAVFSSPQSYTVQTGAGQPLGTLSQAFVDRLVDGVSCFLLGGRAWAVLEVRHDDRRVVVGPAPRGRQPTWGGFIPQFLGETLCRKVRDVLTVEDAYSYLTPEAAALLTERRDSLGRLLAHGQPAVEIDDEIRWWTFAGGRINSTLRYGLGTLLPGVQIIPDNFLLRLRGDDLSYPRFQEALATLRTPAFWENEELWSGVFDSLPGYRLSKFQPLMPPWVEREVIARYLLDAAGAERWLALDQATS
jgi:ATP-dependent helicase Lhr and Lhr-like helicase